MTMTETGAFSTIEGALEAHGLLDPVIAPRQPHRGALPPGLPCGVMEDCGDFGVWWYVRPHGRHGFVVRWAVAPRVDYGSLCVYRVGDCTSELLTRADAVARAV